MRAVAAVYDRRFYSCWQATCLQREAIKPAVIDRRYSRTPSRGKQTSIELRDTTLGNVVPVAEVQQVPFAFRSAAHAHQTMDGPLGAYVREEMMARGIWGFRAGAFDNGMRQIGGT